MQKPIARKHLSPLNIFYFCLGLGLLYWLLKDTDLAQLFQLIANIKKEYLILGGVIYFLKGLMRSVRLARSNKNAKPGILSMLRLTLASSLASQLLPFKLGELSYVYLVKKEFKRSVSQGLSSLMIVRIFDLLAISLLFVLTSLVLGIPTDLSIYFFYILGFICLLLLLLFVLLLTARNHEVVLNLLDRLTGIIKLPLVARIQHALKELFVELAAYSMKDYGEFIIYALIEWSINYAMYHLILIGMNLSPQFFDTVVGVTFAALASVLPVNSFGNFGTQEAGWATGLLFLGYSQQTAIASGFATHLLSLAYMLVLGGAAWISYAFNVRFSSRAIEETT